MKITVGARASNLSKAQVQEVLLELQKKHPKIDFEPLYLQTVGDRDLEASLKDLDKTDFFSRDIDKAQIERKCRIAIHSAKDLMDPLPEGLKLIALTTGLDPSDVLVFRSKSHLKALPKGSCIGCSSSRRENAVKKLREDLVFKEVRGPIERRLEALEKEEVDGLVVAEAAILRLKLTHLNRIKLPYVAAPLQGQLAVTALENDREMEELFATIDSR